MASKLLRNIAVSTLFAASPTWALETITLAPSNEADVIIVDGTLEAINQATLTAQTSGRVTAIHYDVDDYVAQGAVVLELENSQQSARRDRALAAREEAQAAADEAGKNFARVEELVSSGTLSQSDFDKARANRDAARARLKQAEAALAEAEQQLAYTRPAAPYNGIVTERFVEPGELANPGTPLISGLSLERIRVTAVVPQRHVDAVRQQQALTVVLDDGTRLASERITVFPYAEKGSHSFRIRAELDANVDGIYPGMFARVELVTGERDILLVPESALIRRHELTAVYTVAEGQTPRLTQVRLGRTLADGVEVLSGLQEGDRIAIDANAVLAAQTGE